ncbi:hypothetical protein [Nocardia sp. BMG111209]|uniref:hypothetical protein n=1 Tax=Nocardia sp. BMG111209 TaxID=1160137 RepID=UPI0003634F20|nr:hypothetical protein [Nocardia sp. BMG111209]
MESPEDSQPTRSANGNSTTTRTVAIVAVAVAIVAVAALIGVLFDRSGKDVDPQSVAATGEIGNGPAGDGRHNGDDCAEDEVTGQWAVRNGHWECLPLVRMEEHRLGEDCSHDGLVAQWGLVVGRGWECVSQVDSGGTQRDGADCSHNGITSHWERPVGHGWECVPGAPRTLQRVQGTPSGTATPGAPISPVPGAPEQLGAPSAVPGTLAPQVPEQPVTPEPPILPEPQAPNLEPGRPDAFPAPAPPPWLIPFLWH